MDKTYGLEATDLTIQLMYFRRKYFGALRGEPKEVKVFAEVVCGNIIRRNLYTESDRKGIQQYARKHGFTYEQIAGVVEGALSAWIVHVENFKSNMDSNASYIEKID